MGHRRVAGLPGPRHRRAGRYTERSGPYTLASDTEQLGAFLTALHLTPADGAIPVLVGHSSGAAIVTDLARLQPASVRRIVLMDGDGTPYGVGPGWIHSLFVDPTRPPPSGS